MAIRRFIPLAALAAIALALLCTAAPLAQAAVTSVTATPSTATVSDNGGSLSLRWTVVRFTAGGGAGTVSSPQIVITLDGRTIHTVATALSQPTPGNTTLSFSETVSIPASVARQIATGGGTARVTRTFTDSLDGLSATGFARMGISGGSGPVDVSRISLAFSDGSQTRIVGRNDRLTAIADIRYSGSGVLSAAWVLAGPDGLRGSGLARTIETVRRPLVSGANARTRLPSRPLPTDTPGLFEITFRIAEADGITIEASIRYYVVPDPVGTTPAITVLSPPADAALTGETRFSWQPVGGAAAYQIEIFRTNRPVETNAGETDLLFVPADTPPLTGRVVPGDHTASALDAASLRHLALGDELQWRIRALGPNGELLGLSALRPIRR